MAAFAGSSPSQSEETVAGLWAAPSGFPVRSPHASTPSNCSVVLMYLLDTNVVSELREPKPHGAVLKWIDEVDENDIFLSAVTVGELHAGIELTPPPGPPTAED